PVIPFRPNWQPPRAYTSTFQRDEGNAMLKRMLLPLLAVAVLAACGNKEEEATTAAPEATPPAATAPAAPETPAAEAPAAPAAEAPAATASAGGDAAAGEAVYKKT